MCVCVCTVYVRGMHAIHVCVCVCVNDTMQENPLREVSIYRTGNESAKANNTEEYNLRRYRVNEQFGTVEADTAE